MLVLEYHPVQQHTSTPRILRRILHQWPPTAFPVRHTFPLAHPIAHNQREAIDHLPSAADGVKLAPGGPTVEDCKTCNFNKADQQISRVPTPRGTLLFERMHFDITEFTTAPDSSRYFFNSTCDNTHFVIFQNPPDEDHQQVRATGNHEYNPCHIRGGDWHYAQQQRLYAPARAVQTLKAEGHGIEDRTRDTGAERSCRTHQRHCHRPHARPRQCTLLEPLALLPQSRVLSREQNPDKSLGLEDIL
ncbi:hypothetical protein VTN31DRAFT_5897 [Thermomyces dupontii]|uniref:uncharacterized protein n=1 Tax=Talaromyces thermophilus TaxID=28565 RepID=UPI003743018C